MRLWFLSINIFFSILLAWNANADTLHTKDGKVVMGIIVEDYKDRVVVSTVDGEVTLKKSDLRDMSFDNEEDNLIKLGDRAKDKKEFDKAYSYYKMALKINPDSKTAKDGIVFLQGYLFRQEQVAKEDEIKKQENLERYGTTMETTQGEIDKLKESAGKLKRTLGITLEMRESFPVIVDIDTDSAAYDSGLKKGDAIVAVWGKLTGYMGLGEVMDLLLEKPSLEIKATIERTVDVAIDREKWIPMGTRDLIGADFKMELDGLTIANYREGGPSFDAGIEKGDLVTAIDGRSTRYMPLKDAVNMVKNTREESIKLTIRRETLIWRRDNV